MNTLNLSSLIKGLKISMIIFAFGFSITACTDDDDDSVDQQATVNPNEEELITSVEVIFSDTNNAVIDTFRFRDTDGDGGNLPVIDSILIMSNSNYLVELRFLDESDPADVEDITVEIQIEADEHLICFESSPATAINIQRTDSDGTYELGLQSAWQTFAPQLASVEVTLKHQPGVKNGSCSPGETDVQISFPVRLQ